MRRRNGLAQHHAVIAALLIGLVCVADAGTRFALAAGPTAPIRPTALPEPVPPPPPTQAASARWTTFGRDMQRTGYNPNENVLSPQTVPGLKPRWAVDVGGPVLTQPLVYNGLVYVANMNGGVFALNATTGAGVWSVQLPAVQTTCDDFAASGGVVGVLATPTIDTTQNRMFVTAGDGTLHALDTATGNELPGYPLQLLAPGTSPALNAVYGSPTLYQSPLGAVSVMYVATASVCDTAPFLGQVVQVLPNTAQVSNRWYTDGTNGVSGGGIWGPGGVSLETDGSAIYAATGNSLGAVDNVPYSDSVVKLTNTLALLSFDSPALAGTDIDFGATPLLYQPPGCPPLAAAKNKTGAMLIYNRGAIGGGAIQRIQVANPPDPAQGDFIQIPAYDPVLNQVYVTSTDDSAAGPYQHGLLAFAVQSNCTLAVSWQQAVGVANIAGNNPTIAPTAANGVVYYADGIGSQVYAFNAANGQGLWTSGTFIQGGIFAAPTVAGGQVFVSGLTSHLVYAFGP